MQALRVCRLPSSAATLAPHSNPLPATVASRTQTTRYALITYGVVLVLPTIIMGLLYWGQLQREHDSRLAAIPEEAQDAARRVMERLQGVVEQLLGDEDDRPFYEYAVEYASVDSASESLTVVASPLVEEGPPRGVLGWFSYVDTEESQSKIHVFPQIATDRENVGDRRQQLSEIGPVLERYRKRKQMDTGLERISDFSSSTKSRYPMAVAAVAYWQGQDLDCIREHFNDTIKDWLVVIDVSDFTLEFYLEEDGTPRAFATRMVIISTAGRADFPSNAHCVEPIARDAGLLFRQGLVLDVDWLTNRRPRALAVDTLNKDQRLVEPEENLPFRVDSNRYAEILPIQELGFRYRTQDEQRHGRLEVEVDTAAAQDRFARSVRRFLGVGLLLVVTLMTGIRLLYLNVQRELDQAHRMQNFVAAITHELRTPLSAIRLHGEMLLDGWATDPVKQREYYKRILRETERLSTLVERVLEKSRLKEDVIRPHPGSLNDIVRTIAPALEAAEGGIEDLNIQLDESLPLAMLTREAVAGILSNLVENARKYAPVGGGDEPILVRTYLQRDKVILEVADRGPGIPAGEKERIFEAFYRSGNESTRKAIGTGLGLHLVELHATAVGGRVSVHDRPQGGSAFRVAFNPVG
ncbi:MAG: two-component system phosphate regulon sensor histidine kinase PhoR [Gammaproteobacteria bacterium]|jgi:two-component system phosphate regulon sensor histidine kinase PhoR